MIQQIDHLGIAVSSIEEALTFYESALGLKCEGTEVVEAQKVRTAFIPCDGVDIELLEPTADDSPIAKFIAKNGEGIHHIAFRTDDLKEQLLQASDNGAQLIYDDPRKGANNKLIAFLHPKSTHGVLMELCTPMS